MILRQAHYYGISSLNTQNNKTLMQIPENLKFDYLLCLDNHLETEGKDNKEKTLKRIFEITKKIADLGFGENDIHAIVKDEELYLKYDKWRKDNNY